MGEHLVQHLGIGRLVLDRAIERRHVGTDAAFQPGAPVLDGAARGLGRRLAGQPLAREVAHRLGERHVILRFCAAQAGGAATLLRGGGEIGGDPLHPARAERFDPHLLERVEHGGCGLAMRREPSVHRRIVVAERQGHGIRLAAQPPHLDRREFARRHRQARLRFHQPRLGAERHGDVVALGHGTHDRGGHPPERLDRMFLARHLDPYFFFATTDSASSALKQRW